MTSVAKMLTLALLLFAAHARADEPLSQLERELDLHAAEGRKERLWNGALSVALAGALMPSGIVMTKREDDLVRLIGIGTVITGGVQLLRVPGLFFASDMERLRARHVRRKASGLSGDALLRETERDWAEQARKKDQAQKWIGGFHLGIGAVAIPLGLTFMLRDHVGDVPHTKQINVGSTLLGIGVGYLAVAAQLLSGDGLTERTWKQHALTRRVSLGIAPAASGALLSASGRF
ncbi:MAG TPA: hypothetical protein VI299_29055 [Polyangiales bacterium]